MKKLILSAIVFCLSAPVFSQLVPNTDSLKKKKKEAFYLLIHGWANYSGIGGESESYRGSVVGAYVGASTNILKISKDVGIDLGLGFSQQGGGYEMYQYIPGGEGGKQKASVRLNYLVAPVTATYQTKNGFFGEAGLRPAILLSAKDKYNGETDDIKSDYKGFDMSAVIGAGYQFKNNVGVEVHYFPGIVNINKNGTLKDRNRSISLGAFYKL